MSSGHSPPPAFQGHPSRSSSLGVAALGWESATSWVLGSREVRDRETDSRGCGLQTHLAGILMAPGVASTQVPW